MLLSACLLNRNSAGLRLHERQKLRGIPWTLGLGHGLQRADPTRALATDRVPGWGRHLL